MATDAKTVTAPAYRTIPIVPALQAGAMAGVKSYVANEKIQEAIGFPGKLADDWQTTHDAVIEYATSLNDCTKFFSPPKWGASMSTIHENTNSETSAITYATIAPAMPIPKYRIAMAMGPIAARISA